MKWSSATGAKGYRKHAELLADPAVDVVCIATPDRLHVPQALDAIRAGKRRLLRETDGPLVAI